MHPAMDCCSQCRCEIDCESDFTRPMFNLADHFVNRNRVRDLGFDLAQTDRKTMDNSA